MQQLTLITAVLDKYFSFIEELANIYPTEFVPDPLIDRSKQSDFDGMTFWKAIKSTTTIAEIEKFEAWLGRPLPESYRFFLMSRHFVELQLGEYGVRFFPHLPENELTETLRVLDNKGYIDNGFLPIAEFNDTGLLCFDLNMDELDYPLVTFETGEFEYSEIYPNDFLSTFYEFEQNLDEWISNVRKKNNSA